MMTRMLGLRCCCCAAAGMLATNTATNNPIKPSQNFLPTVMASLHLLVSQPYFDQGLWPPWALAVNLCGSGGGKCIGLRGNSTLWVISGHMQCKKACRFSPESGHSIAADYDLMAMRAAAFEPQQADELAFAKSNTKRLIVSTDLSRSPDTSRSLP